MLTTMEISSVKPGMGQDNKKPPQVYPWAAAVWCHNGCYTATVLMLRAYSCHEHGLI